MAKPVGYTRTQVLLHWVVALLVILQLIFHEPMALAWDRAVETGLFALSLPVVAHFAGGLAILMLMAWRAALRREIGAPDPHPDEDPRLARIAHLLHLGFYVVLIALPVSGGLAWGLQSGALSLVHEILRAVLAIFILLHLAGTGYHRFVLKTNVLQRMTRPVD